MSNDQGPMSKQKKFGVLARVIRARVDHLPECGWQELESESRRVAGVGKALGNLAWRISRAACRTVSVVL
jgi:hypothetical protein